MPYIPKPLVAMINTYVSEYQLKKQQSLDIDFDELSKTPHAWAIKLLRQKPTRIDWTDLSQNTHPHAIKLLQKNPDKIIWYGLSANPNPRAIKMLQENPKKISWMWFVQNSHPWAIKMMQENPDKTYYPLLHECPVCPYRKIPAWKIKMLRRWFEYSDSDTVFWHPLYRNIFLSNPIPVLI